MTWILAVSLLSNPDGFYTRQFATEAQCIVEMNQFIQRNRENPLVKGVACLNNEEFALEVTE